MWKPPQSLHRRARGLRRPADHMSPAPPRWNRWPPALLRWPAIQGRAKRRRRVGGQVAGQDHLGGACHQVLFPQIKTIYGYRQDALPWHPNGLAIDVMIPDHNSPEGIELGNQIAGLPWRTPSDGASTMSSGGRRSTWAPRPVVGRPTWGTKPPTTTTTCTSHRRRRLPNRARNVLHRLHVAVIRVRSQRTCSRWVLRHRRSVALREKAGASTTLDVSSPVRRRPAPSGR